ncbi:MAG: GTP 3',8-cyclase MoaA [Verrucomicrobiales bacterium]
MPTAPEKRPRKLEDAFGHRISYLRISVTDRCNERCHYCMAEETQHWLPREEILSYEEILRVVRVGVGLGVRKVRVTGGEPLTRRDVLGFLRRLGAMEGIEDVGVSTNGTLLAAPSPERSGETVAGELRAAGVRSINVSLDTLDREHYRQTTGRDFLPRVFDGLDAARDAGIAQVKLNAVLMRDRNQDQILDLIEFAHQRGLLLRFIELMPVSTRDVLTEENFLSTAAARRIVEGRFGVLEPLPDFRTNGPASYFRIPGREQRIGFIGAMTNLHFCESCNKLRLTCEGKLRPCLGSHLEFDIKKVLRDPSGDDEAVRNFFRMVVERKPEAHDFREGYLPDRKMIAIGG